MRVAALQFDVRRGAHEHNLAEVERGLHAAQARGVELVVLPEMWASSFPGPEPDLARLVERDEASQRRVAELSRELGLAVCGSSFGARAGAKPANRWRLVDRGETLASYDKAHLFSVTAEPEHFSAGDEPPPLVELRGVRTSGCICYDLRFVELTRFAFEAGCELMLVPAQWPNTRATHWRALVVGLAAANQCFVVACNRTGVESLGRRPLQLEFPGNSLVVDPGGVVLAEGDGSAGLVTAELAPEAARELRRRVPVARDRRPALYSAWRAR